MIKDTLCKCNFFILMYSNERDITKETESIKKWINRVKRVREEKEYLNPKVITHFFILGNNASKDDSYNIKEKMEKIKGCFENANLSIHDVGLVNMNGETLDKNKKNVHDKFDEINKIFKKNLDKETITENEKNFIEISKKYGKKLVYNFDGITNTGEEEEEETIPENENNFKEISENPEEIVNLDEITKTGKDNKKDKKCENCPCYFF